MGYQDVIVMEFAFREKRNGLRNQSEFVARQEGAEVGDHTRASVTSVRS